MLKVTLNVGQLGVNKNAHIRAAGVCENVWASDKSVMIKSESVGVPSTQHHKHIGQLACHPHHHSSHLR